MRVALAALLLLAVPLSAAATGEPRVFGDDGWASWRPADPPEAVAVEPDGGIVVESGGTIRRLTAAAAPDRSFDRAAARSLGGGAPAALAIDSQGRIVVTLGHSVVRLTAAGTRDASFGDGGAVHLAPLTVGAVTLAADGSIVVGAWSASPAGAGRLIRIGADGTVDSSFQGALGSPAATPGELVIDALGRTIVAVGDPSVPAPYLERHLADGTLDPSFAGEATLEAAGLIPDAIAIQPDGKVLVAGHILASSGPPLPVLARLSADGTLDPAFGRGGIVTTTTWSAELQRTLYDSGQVAVQPGGAIVVAGRADDWTAEEPGTGWSWYVRRFSSFGGPGALGAGPDLINDQDCNTDEADAVAVEPSGEVVVAGSGACPDVVTDVVTRYTPDLRLEGLPTLELRVAPGHPTVLEASRSIWGGVQARTRIEVGAAARLTIAIRPGRKLADGAIAPAGRAVLLMFPATLAGSTATGEVGVPSLASVTYRQGGTGLLAAVRNPIPGTAWYLVELRAVDARGRRATLEIPMRVRR
jgi:uncharacterized delta-60 repeat protein